MLPFDKKEEQMEKLKNSKGQSLIEYLILVAVIAIGSIGIVRGLGHTILVRYANITNALQNKSPELQPEAVNAVDYQKKGLDDFFKSATGPGTP
jgi:Flp pilus assembly pilin Flp